MDSVCRSLAILRPKQPYLDWCKSIPDPTLDAFPVTDVEPDGFLIPLCESVEEAMTYMERNCRAFMEYMFEQWWLDEKDWGNKRDWKTFQEWFDIEIIINVTEPCGAEIEVVG